MRVWLACACSICLLVMACKGGESAQDRTASPAMAQADAADGGVSMFDSGQLQPPLGPRAEAAKPMPKMDAGAARRPDAAARDVALDAGGDAGPADPAQRDAMQPMAADGELTPLIVSEVEPLSAITGQYGPNRSAQQFYAADLGWVARDHDKLWVVFGDSWTSGLVHTIDVNPRVDADDAIGWWSLTDLPDGAAAERFIREHPAGAGKFSWQAEPPPLSLALNPSSQVATPLLLQREGTTIPTGSALTPLTAFANELDGDSAGFFGVFFRNQAVECSSGECESGWTCDTGLGLCTARDQAPKDGSMPCVLGSAATSICETCAAVQGGGLCVDTGSSTYDPNVARGRTGAVPRTHEVGNMLRGSDHIFATQGWNTQRFFTVTARTARSFDPADPAKNDYRPLDAPEPEHGAVLLWGRPHLGGVHKQHRDLHLYFAWMPLPRYAEDGHFEWKPRYFAGLDSSGTPQFVERELDAASLDLDAAQSGEQPQELIDVSGHQTVVWLPSLQRFMLLYGGGVQELYTDIVYGEDAPFVDKSKIGPIYVRYAKHPWGPWTAPEPFAQAGDSTRMTGLYAQGGPLFSTQCSGAECVRPEVLLSNESGGLYAPHVIEPWIQAHPDEHAVDIFWHASNWNPYSVILMKSTLREQP